uniref:Retrotransposon gag domain-containing protein n=1 Tax=Aegilops tauschii TaxID=37682 RepID=M8CZK1_AEGTA
MRRRCFQYRSSRHHRSAEHNWVTTAALYVEGHAALWLRAFRQQNPILCWDMFMCAIDEEFGPDEFEYLMHSLLQLRQTRSVVEYKQQFKVLMYNLLALDATPSPKFFVQFLLGLCKVVVTQFLLGLKDELRAVVRLQAPNNITRATVFARIQEEELTNVHPKLRPLPAGRPPPLPYTAPTPGRPPAATTILPAGNPPKPIASAKPASDDFGRER